MKYQRLFLFVTIGFALLSILSCRKINEATEVGGDLIPAVDNVTTFETSLSVENSKYFITQDTTRFFFSDNAVLGKINDPVFGTTTANVYFNLSAQSYGTNPFSGDALAIDSVVLSLSYLGAYGDTSAATTETVRVFEISPAANFRSDTAYKFSDPDFATGPQLGIKTFSPASLKDTVRIIRKDTVRVVNVLRIPLSNSIAQRFASFDTTNTANGGFRNDSIFKSLFKGIAIRAEAFTGNGALSYFSLRDAARTNMTVYYKVTRNGVRDTASFSFFHSTNGQANIIHRQPGGEFSTYLAQGSSPDGKLYIQSTPGSHVSFKVPGLDTFKNKVIHRAELIVHRVPSLREDIFTPPARLFLDKISDTGSKAYFFENDLPLGADGSIDFATFGGILRRDNTYRFSLTRHVQGIVTRKDPNFNFRLYAPLRAQVYSTTFNSPLSLPINNNQAQGRVVVAGGNYVVPAQRMRLRIIYSNL